MGSMGETRVAEIAVGAKHGNPSHRHMVLQTIAEEHESRGESGVHRLSSLSMGVDEQPEHTPTLSVSSDSRKSSAESGIVDKSRMKINNNGNGNNEISEEELELLKKLEAQNKLIETDAKSLNSLQSGHSRRSSDTSQISVASGGSEQQQGPQVGQQQQGQQQQQGVQHQNGHHVTQNGVDCEEDQWTTWSKIINEWDISGKRRLSQIKDLVRSKGIPHHFRGMAWQLLSDAHDAQERSKFAEYLKTQSACEKVIRRDITRTYPEHDFFKEKNGVGQEALFNVMKAYSIHDREVGYCQGSAFIVGLLLMQMPEEEAFCVLVKLMQVYRMREMFKPSMAELGLCMYQLENLVQEHLPDLYAHFQSQAIHTNLYASSWFLTLFSTALSLPMACRVMDCFLADGIEVIFRLALALLILAQDKLLLQDMEGVIKYFQKDMPLAFEAECEHILAVAYGIKINQKKMKRLEKHYTTMKTKEKEDEIELRRLRTENRLLRQRVDLLEQESSSLADRLIQGQVTRAEIEENAFAMKRELAAIRQHDLDTNQQLVEAKDRIRKLSSIVDTSIVDRANSLDPNTPSSKQKEEMIHCLQDELVKERLRAAENEDRIRSLMTSLQEQEQETQRLRDNLPNDNVASLQEQLAAAKLREAEANLALKELRMKVNELNHMWQKHVNNNNENGVKVSQDVPSTPKKLLGSLLESNNNNRSNEELVTARMREVEAEAALKEERLKVMELETQNQVIANQLKRQSDEIQRLRDNIENMTRREAALDQELRDAKRAHSDLDSRIREDAIMARIKEAENAQIVAELTQKISSIEYKNEELRTQGEIEESASQSEKVRELQDKIASLRAQSGNFELPTPLCTPVVEYKLFAPSQQ